MLAVAMLATVLLGLSVASAAVAPGKGAGAASDVASQQAAMVVVDGEPLFRVRGISAFPADRRARQIAQRIVELAADPNVAPEAIRVEERKDRSVVRAGDRDLFVVFDADAELEGVPRKLLAETDASRVRTAVESYRRQRTRGYLLESAARVGVATAVFAILLVATLWLTRRLLALVDRRYKWQIERAAARAGIWRADRILAALRVLLRLLRALVVLAIAYAYLTFTLELFPWTRPFAGHLSDLVLGPLETIARAFVSDIPDLFFLAVLVVLTRYALRGLHYYFDAIERGRIHLAGFEPEWATPTYRIARLAVVAFAVVMAYPYIPGSGSEAFKGLSIFLGVILSIGSSSAISNIVAGYSIIYRRAFKVGDRVRVGEILGDVEEMRLLVTRLRSLKNEVISVPNSVILASEVVNFSTLARTEGLILHTTVGIGYEVPWRQVEAMLEAAAERAPGLKREPRPFVLEKALGDFAVTYELNAYANGSLGIEASYTALHRSILDVFNEYGVQIMTPAYVTDPAEPKRVPRDRWHLPPAAQEEALPDLAKPAGERR